MQSTKSRPNKERSGVTLHAIPESAKLLGVSESHVYRLIAAGELRVVDVAVPGSGKPKSRIRSDDIDGYIERSTRTA